MVCWCDSRLDVGHPHGSTRWSSRYYDGGDSHTSDIAVVLIASAVDVLEQVRNEKLWYLGYWMPERRMVPLMLVVSLGRVSVMITWAVAQRWLVEIVGFGERSAE